MEVEWKVDDGGFVEMCKKLNAKEIKKAERRALAAGMQAIKTQAKKNLRQVVNGANRQNPKYNDKLQDAVRNTKLYYEGDNATMKVHAMGTRKKGSGTFRARFFEVGTRAPRKTDENGKKVRQKNADGTDKIHMRARPFFEPAVQAKQEEAARKIDERFVKALDEMIEKRYPSAKY